MKLYDRLILGEGKSDELVATEVGNSEEKKPDDENKFVVKGSEAAQTPETNGGADGGEGGAGTAEDGAEEDAAKKKKKRKMLDDYSSHAMKELSQKQRAEMGIRDEGFEYGEIDPMAFFEFLFKLKTIHGHFWPPQRKRSPPPPKKSMFGGGKKAPVLDEPEPPPPFRDAFMDLGAGSGKAVFAAALFFEFKSVGGIEMLTNLADAANDLRERFIDEVRPALGGLKGETPVDFETNDLVQSSKWNEEGSYLFVNGPTFSAEVMEQLAIRANGKGVAGGSVAIVVSKPWASLDNSKWILIAEDKVRMTWGEPKVYVYEKIPDKVKAPSPEDEANAKGKKKKGKKKRS
mmetsp:Transcript_61203/g.138469  ORF Transcript_61203/g.138469 Transcript_61203/m.138469 type:complete len:346 (-) Transcript_61203:196-1233(-)